MDSSPTSLKGRCLVMDLLCIVCGWICGFLKGGGGNEYWKVLFDSDVSCVCVSLLNDKFNLF